MTLADLLATPFDIPSMPRMQALLLTELARPDPSLRRIDQCLSTDPGLTLQLLRQANAPDMQLSGQIHSVSEALAVLRLSQVQALATVSTTSSAVRTLAVMPMAQFWAYSLDCAKVARSVAGLLKLNQQAAFSCGLLHAVGELLMRSASAQVLALDAQFPVLALQRARLEYHALGFCYSQVSAALARQWYFPQLMVDALDTQHVPFDSDVCEPLAAVLHLAIWRARARQIGLHDNALTVTFPSLVAELLGLDIDMVLQQDPIDWTAQVTRPIHL